LLESGTLSNKYCKNLIEKKDTGITAIVIRIDQGIVAQL
jgi:hypothetical protein